MKRSCLIVLIYFFYSCIAFSQGNNCSSATPFCTAVGTPFSFPNNVGTSAPSGPSYGCLGSEPNPGWFFLKTSSAGAMSFTISQADTLGTGIDVDYIVYGPFSSLANACGELSGTCSPGLSCVNCAQTCTGNIVACSYSTAAIETMTINSPGPGNYYLLMVTNFAGVNGIITITEDSGPATDCSITCPVVTGGNGYLVSPGGAAMPASVNCNSADINLVASTNTPFGNPVTPGIIISFNGNGNSTNTVNWYENGVYQTCFGPACPLPIVANSENDLQISGMSPSAANLISLCETSSTASNIPYTITDAASGSVLSTGTWLDDGVCQDINFPAGTLSGVSSWSISPACPGCLTTTDWGAAIFSPSVAGAGTWNICYSFDPPGTCANYNYCQNISVANPFIAAWTAPAAICANAGLVNLTSLLNAGTTVGGTWSGTGVSGTDFNPSVSGVGSFPLTYTVGSGNCSATQSHPIVVSPVTVATATPSSQVMCSGSTTGIALSGSVTGTTYSWTVVQTNVSGATPGSGSSIAQLLTATSATAGTAVYTITPTAAGCTGVPITVTITVNPKPVVTATPLSQLICSGSATSIALTSSASGTTYNWTVSQVNASGASAGSGSFIAQTLTTTSTISGTVVYTVTPTTGSCTGSPITVTITVNPKPVLTVTPASQSICSGSATGIILTSNVPSTTYSWTVVQTNVSGATASSGSSIAQSLTATSSVSGTAVYTVTPAVGGCAGDPVTVIVTVNPKPVVTATPASQSFCSGGTTAIDLTSTLPGTTYAWTVTHAGVLGSLAGSGSTIAQTLTATTATAGTVIYTVTPTASSCSGTPINVMVTVNPKPVVTATPASQTLCSGSTTGISLTSNIFGTTFDWTAVQTDVSGATAGSGSSIAQLLTATSSVPGTVVYSITPTSGGCIGNPVNVTVTVKPAPVATATPSSQTICSGDLTGIALTSDVSATTFAWTVVQTNVSGGSAGSGVSIAQALTATSSIAGTAVYTITPIAGGCSGNPITVTITVNPKPAVTTTPASQTICSWNATGITLAGSVAGTTFSWTATQSGVIGATAGFGSDITDVLTTTGVTAGSATYIITPSVGGCNGNPVSVTVIVNPLPSATAFTSFPAICSGDVGNISLTGDVVGTTFAWTAVQTNASGASSGSGSSILQTLTATSSIAGTVDYTITPTANGCVGTTATATITVNPKPVATATPASQTFCTGGTTGVLLSSTVTGTTYSWTVVQTGVSGAAPGSGAAISQTLSSTGSIAGTAVYTVTPDAGGCSGVPLTVNITVNPKDDASFTYPSSTYCQTGTNPTATITGVSGGTFSASPAGLVFTSTTDGTINLSGSTLGTYTVTYTTAGSCPNTCTVMITITNAPAAGFSYTGSPYCQYGTNPTPSFTGSGSAGIFSATPAGLVFVNVNTGQVNLSASTPGTYTVTNTIAASGSCTAVSATSSITITAAPVATATPATQTICSGTATSIALSSSLGATSYSWTIAQAGVSGAAASSGSAIAQTLTATGTTPGTVVYTITPVSGGCSGLPVTVTITVNPKPVATATPAFQTLCSGGTTAATLTSTVPGTTYSWTVSHAAASGGTAGSGTAIAQTINATGSIPGGAIYTITPSANGCAGLPASFTAIVNPNPVAIATPASRNICSGTTTGIALTSTATGATFAWTVTQTGVSGAASGTGTSIDQVLTATGTVAGTAVYTVIPTANGCQGNPLTVTITVKPIPVATATPSIQTICSGSIASSVLSSTVTGTTFAWTVIHPGVSGSFAGSGFSISQTLVATGTVAGNVVYTITPTAATCTGNPVTFSVIVNPKPVAIATPAIQTICSGSTSSIVLTSAVPGTTFAWTVVQTDVSGATAGSGSSITQTLSATGVSPGTAVYTVTPTANGCSGSPITITVTVNPIPFVVATPSSQTICSGGSTGIALGSFISGTTFFWTIAQTGVTGAVNGSGTNISQVLTTTGSVPGTAVYTITPTTGGCNGSPTTVTITVNPKPVVTATPLLQSVCSGGIASISLASTIPGTTYSWTVVQTSVSGASAGSGSAIMQTLTATGTVIGTAVYTITPTANGCSGTPITATVRVIPVSVATATPSTQTRCSGFVTSVFLSSGVAGTTYSWTVVQTGVSGASSGSGSSIAQILSATGPVAGTAVYTITPAVNGCPGTPTTVTINVNPIPVATAIPSSQTICSGTAPSISLTSNVTGASFVWSVAQSGATGASAGSGTSIAQTLTASGVIAGTASYTITPSSAGCTGSSIVANVTVNPVPVITAAPAIQTFCDGGTSSIALSSTIAGTSINWTVAQAGVSGGTAGTGVTIADVLHATGTSAGIATYTVTSNAAGCAGNPVTATVNVNPLDDAGFTYPSSTYCQEATNPSATITGLAGGTFSVSPSGLVLSDSLTGLLNLVSSLPGNYTITYHTNGVCSSSSTIPLRITNIPSASFTYASPFCSSDSNPFPAFTTESSAGTFTASPSGLTFINTNTGEIDIAASTPGTYTVINSIASMGLCTAAADTVFVTINQGAIVNAGAGGSVCEEGSYTLSGTMGGSTNTITWTTSGTGTFTDVNSLTAVYSPSPADVIAGHVLLSITSNDPGNACHAVSDTMTLTIIPLDSVALSYPATSFCHSGVNPSPMLTGISGGLFTYNPAGLSIDTTGAINLAASGVGAYNVYYTTNGVCPNSDTVAVSITPSPVATFSFISGITAFCKSDANPAPVFGSGASAGIFTSSPSGLVFADAVSGSVDLAGSVPGTYTIINIIAAAGGCASSIDSATITISLPAIVEAGPDAAICSGDVYTIAGDSIGGSTSALTWTSNGTGSFSSTDSLATTYTPSLTDAAIGFVTLYITSDDPAGACEAAKDSLLLIINPTPVAPAVDDTIIHSCAGTPLSPINAAGSGGTITWYSDSALTTVIGGNPLIPGTSLGTTNYWVAEMLGTCRSSATQVTITIHPLPVANTSSLVITDASCGITNGSITGITVSSGLAPYSFQWQDASGLNVGAAIDLMNAGAGVYSLTITDSNSCSVSAGPYTIIAPSLIAAYTPNPASGETPLTVDFTNTSIGAISYLWLFGTGDTSTVVNPEYIYKPLGTFNACLIAYNSSGCADTACSSIDIYINSVFVIPNVFSPNDDGVNDVFTIIGKGLATLDAEIYNRWGQKEYGWKTIDGGWDGHTATGLKATEGTYYYSIKATGIDGKEYVEKGYFTLVR